MVSAMLPIVTFMASQKKAGVGTASSKARARRLGHLVQVSPLSLALAVTAAIHCKLQVAASSCKWKLPTIQAPKWLRKSKFAALALAAETERSTPLHHTPDETCALSAAEAGAQDALMSFRALVLSSAKMLRVAWHLPQMHARAQSPLAML